MPSPHPHDHADPGLWAGVPSAVVSDCMERFGAMRGIRRLAGTRVVGPAYPVQTMGGENGTIHRALRDAPMGAVLVVDAAGAEERAVWGEVLTVAAEQAQLRGVVVDGLTRDHDGIVERGFPLFARGTSPAGPHKGWRGRHGRQISCGGVVVDRGDVVIGDGDGVVVVPRERAAAIHATALERIAQEEEWIERLRAGEPSTSILGIDVDEEDST